MKNILVITFIFLGCALFAAQSPAFSQTNPDPVITASPASPAAAGNAAAEDEDKFAFGTVVGAANGEITVQEHAVDQDIDVKSVYTVNAETEFGNIDSVEHLKPGDNVVLDYVEKDGKRTVTTLVKEESQEAEEVSSESTVSVNAESHSN